MKKLYPLKTPLGTCTMVKVDSEHTQNQSTNQKQHYVPLSYCLSVNFEAPKCTIVVQNVNFAVQWWFWEGRCVLIQH